MAYNRIQFNLERRIPDNIVGDAFVDTKGIFGKIINSLSAIW